MIERDNINGVGPDCTEMQICQKERFPKLKEFEIKMLLMFGNTHMHIFYNEATSEWQAEHWTTDSDLRTLTFALIKERQCQNSLDPRHHTDRDLQ